MNADGEVWRCEHILGQHRKSDDVIFPKYASIFHVNLFYDNRKKTMFPFTYIRGITNLMNCSIVFTPKIDCNIWTDKISHYVTYYFQIIPRHLTKVSMRGSRKEKFSGGWGDWGGGHFVCRCCGGCCSKVYIRKLKLVSIV